MSFVEIHCGYKSHCMHGTVFLLMSWRSVGLSDSVLVTTIHTANMDELIEMPFGGRVV